MRSLDNCGAVVAFYCMFWQYWPCGIKIFESVPTVCYWTLCRSEKNIFPTHWWTDCKGQI